MKKQPLLLLLMWFSLVLQAQDFDDYQLLKGEGSIPQEFLTPSSTKYNKAKATIAQGEARQNKKDKDQFYLESNFLIDDLLQSGKVLFNDPITKYINKVGKELLKDNPDLKAKIRFYAVRSTAVNAFATNQGIVFVNVGLIAQLETEAQLAFILAHEIAHIQKKHVLDMYMEAQDIDRNTSRNDLVKQSSFDDRLIAKNYYSKELETEADKIGLELFLDSQYKLADIDGVFDVLQYSYLPFDINKFDKSFLETEHLKIPVDYLLPEEEVNPIKIAEDEEDDNPKSTHPSIGARRLACADLIGNNSDANRSSYLVGDAAEFEKMRDIARFELCYYYLHQFKYQDALYAVYLLSSKYPESRYLSKIKAKALYAYARFKNEMKGIRPYSVSYSDDDIYVDNMRKKAYKKIEGDLQELYYILNTMKPKELTVLATRHVWDAASKQVQDQELQGMKADIMVELSYYYDSRSLFSSVSAVDALFTVTEDTVSSEKTLSKYDKIKKKKKNKKRKSQDFGTYAFVDIVSSSAFKKAFNKAKTEKERINAQIEYYESEEGRRELRKERKKQSAALGIDSILAITPFYLRVNQGYNSSKVDYLYSEQRQATLSEIIVKNAKIAKVEMSMLNMANIKPEDSQQFNDLRILSEWISQQSRFGGNLLMKGFNQAAVDNIIQRYDKRYLLFTVVLSVKRARTDWMFWSVLYDMETGRYKIIKEDYYKRRDNNSMLNAHLFDVLFQIKSKRKK